MQKKKNNNEIIRVAQVIGKLASAGVEAVVNNYYRHMDHNIFQFDYYVDEDSECAPSQEMINLGAHYYFIPSSKHPIARIKKLKKLLKQNPPQIVHSHMNSLNAISLFAAWRVGVPIRISHSHSTSNKQEGLRAVIKNILRRTGGWFATDKMACGDKAGRWLFGNKAVDEEKVFILPNAIDIEKYRFNLNTRQKLRKELNIEDRFVIGHVGRFMKQKNHEFLIRIFAELKKQRDDIILLLVGDGELKSDMEKLVSGLHLQKSVIFLGNRPDVADLYNVMDIFVLPSLYEGVPVVGIEAQANGLPCLFSNHISEESKQDNYVCFLPLEKDFSKWIEKCLYYYDKSTQVHHRRLNYSVEEKDIDNSTVYEINFAADRLSQFYLEKSYRY